MRHNAMELSTQCNAYIGNKIVYLILSTDLEHFTIWTKTRRNWKYSIIFSNDQENK